MAALTLREILSLDVLGPAAPQVLSGESELGRPVRWVHCSELYGIGPQLAGGELLLTAGQGLAGVDAGARRRYLRRLDERGVAGIAVEIGGSLPEVPYELVEEGRRRDFPVVALRRRVPFLRVAEAANTAIVTRAVAGRGRPGEAGGGPESGPRPHADRDAHAAALLRELAEGTALGQADVLARARELGFRPSPRLRLIGVAGPLAEAGLVLLDRAVAEERGAAAIRAVAPDGLLALVALPARPGVDPVRRLAALLDGAAAAAGERRWPRLALGDAVPGGADWTRWGETLREARGALRLALSIPPPRTAPAPGRAGGGAPAAGGGGPLVTSARALALERLLVGDSGVLDPGGRERLGRLVERVLGPLLAWESAHPSDLVRTLEVHLRNGCSATRTAALLHLGRQSLYQRLDRIESLLGVPVADPDLHAELLLATCARRVLTAMTGAQDPLGAPAPAPVSAEASAAWVPSPTRNRPPPAASARSAPKSRPGV
ncbi:PucR family transcriptional regulator [Phaeacidiphilus oryzae]|uniref:PucR family transcriptional regulator n=1 Tax=Phaeacidiphilus oryzae TaxID=348818 RepID=UPI0007C6EC7D|nr:PucR family transcriptional regulator [Phaeacidiphilus oryzae]